VLLLLLYAVLVLFLLGVRDFACDTVGRACEETGFDETHFVGCCVFGSRKIGLM